MVVDENDPMFTNENDGFRKFIEDRETLFREMDNATALGRGGEVVAVGAALLSLILCPATAGLTCITGLAAVSLGGIGTAATQVVSIDAKEAEVRELEANLVGTFDIMTLEVIGP